MIFFLPRNNTFQQLKGFCKRMVWERVRTFIACLKIVFFKASIHASLVWSTLFLISWRRNSGIGTTVV